jgi:outer membrane biosynthesis protein TonB
MISVLSRSYYAKTYGMGLRALALTASLSLHSFIVVPFIISAQTEDEFVENNIVSTTTLQGETLVDEGETTNSIAQEANIASVQKKAEVEDMNLLPIKPADVIASEAETMATSYKTDVVKIDQNKQIETSLTSKDKSDMADTKPQPASAESFAHKLLGSENGTSNNGGATRSAYAALLKKEIERHRKRPNIDVSGGVNVSFAIDEQGHVQNITILNQVSPELANTARAMMSAVTAPPPPGGHFLAAVTIKFE